MVYNSETTILHTLNSVATQTYKNIEHILVDGASTDETIALIRKHSNKNIRLFSEHDKGIYDAMNKGLALATGDIVAYLNADDWYAEPTTVARVVAAFASGVEIVYGDIDLVDELPPHRVRRHWKDAPRSRHAFALGWQPAHPATFMRTEMLRRLGGFDTRFRISADYAMFARCFIEEGVRAVHVPHVLTHMRLGGASTANLKSIVHANRECLMALRERGVRFPLGTIALKLLRKLLQVKARFA